MRWVTYLVKYSLTPILISLCSVKVLESSRDTHLKCKEHSVSWLIKMGVFLKTNKKRSHAQPMGWGSALVTCWSWEHWATVTNVNSWFVNDCSLFLCTFNTVPVFFSNLSSMMCFGICPKLSEQLSQAPYCFTTSLQLLLLLLFPCCKQNWSANIKYKHCQ